MNRMTMLEKTCEASPSPTAKNVYSRSGSLKTEPSEDMIVRRASLSGNRRPSFLSSIRDAFHPRSGSLSEKTSKFLFRRSEAHRRVQIAECEVDAVYDLRDKKEHFYDDEAAFRRPRSNSSDFLILRKTSRPLSVNVIGLIDQTRNPYHQYMQVVKVYELCPLRTKLTVVDSKLTAERAFGVIFENDISSILVWNSDKASAESMLTLTDFLTAIRHESKKPKEEVLVEDILSGNSLVSVTIDSSIYDLCQELYQNKLNRIAVRDGNELVNIVSVRRAIAAIHKQNRSLCFAQWLNRPIGFSTIGNWDRVHTISLNDTVERAIEDMIGLNYSTIPVVNDNDDCVGVITKKDICARLPGLRFTDPSKWLRETKINEIMDNCKREILISSKDNIGFVLDELLNGPSNTAFAIHDKKVIAAISLHDFLDFLLHSPMSPTEEEGPLPTPTSSNGSSENLGFTKFDKHRLSK